MLPHDEHNARLVADVHPPDWVNPEPAGRYNLVVIGAGTAGLVTAAGAAGLGARVALIERHLMGGDCLNVGCVPSKAIIGSARVAATVREAGAFGVRVPEGVGVEFPAVMERMRRLRAGIAPHDSAARFRDLGVDVFLGQGEFSGRETIQVGGQTLRFKKAVIATGARAAAPPIPGLDEVDYLTNETVFSLTELPARMAIVGGGPIGCELAQAFARFGSEVFLIETNDSVLHREDRDAAAIVEAALRRDGVQLLYRAKQMQVAATDRGVRIQLESQGEGHDLEVDRLLVAAGRAPNVEGMNLEAAGVEYSERSGVQVDDKLRTTNKRIFAAGDVCSKYKFTHAADFMARIVIGNALFFGRGKVSQLVIPWCTYTSPEVAHVGLSEADAERDGVAIDTFRQEFAEVDRAILEGETSGFVKIHARQGKDTILGATIVAAHAGDMISQVSQAMRNGVGLKGLANTIAPYPTQAEAIRKLGDQYNRTRLTPLVKTLFEKWLKWRR